MTSLRITCLLAPLTFALLMMSCGDVGPSTTAQQPFAVETSFVADVGPTPNPERGMYRTFSMFDVTSLDGPTIDPGVLFPSNLVLFKYLMYNEAETDYYCDDAGVPATHLDIIDTVCAALRARQMKCVFRIIYSHEDGSLNSCGTTDPGPLGTPAANVTRLEQHLDDMAPKFAANRDVIAFVEAGILGAWGEWNDANLPPGQMGMYHDPAVRRAVVSKLLDILPADRTVVVRRPRFRREFEIGGTPFAADRMARIGFHNDCYLSNPTDQGTYDDAPMPPSVVMGLPAYDGALTVAENWQRYIRDVVASLNVPMGGENCPPFPATPENDALSDCDVAPASMAHLRFTYLNNEWWWTAPPAAPGTINKWATGPDDCLDEIRTHLGYRFVVKRVGYHSSVSPGGQLSLEVDVENVGYAPLVNERPLFAVLRGPATYTTLLQLSQNTDPRTWAAGATTTVKATLRIPADAPEGAYSIRLHLPDANSTLANPTWPHAAAMSHEAYCVRFSNATTWDAGENVLATTTVAAGTPGPTDASATTFAELP